RFDGFAPETLLQIELVQAAERREVGGPQLDRLLVLAHRAEGFARLAQGPPEGEVVARGEGVGLRRALERAARLFRAAVGKVLDSFLVAALRGFLLLGRDAARRLQLRVHAAQ